MSSWPSASTITAVTVGTAATGILGEDIGSLVSSAAWLTSAPAYAVWFDHKRRNDPEFRKELKRSQRRAARIARSQEEAAGQAQREKIKEALKAAKEEGYPSSVEEKEAFFMEQVAQGEQLANDSTVSPLPNQARANSGLPGHNEVDAALCFYRALKVYPQPSDLMSIYDKTVPKPVLDILAEMIAADPAISAGRFGGVDVDE